MAERKKIGQFAVWLYNCAKILTTRTNQDHYSCFCRARSGWFAHLKSFKIRARLLLAVVSREETFLIWANFVENIFVLQLTLQQKLKSQKSLGLKCKWSAQFWLLFSVLNNDLVDRVTCFLVMNSFKIN